MIDKKNTRHEPLEKRGGEPKRLSALVDYVLARYGLQDGKPQIFKVGQRRLPRAG